MIPVGWGGQQAGSVSHIEQVRNMARCCNIGTGTLQWHLHVTNTPEDGRVAVPTREHQFPLFVCWSTLANKFAGSISARLLAFHEILDSCPRYIRNRHRISNPGIGPPPFHPSVRCPRKICMHESAYVWGLKQIVDPLKLCLLYRLVHSLVRRLHVLRLAKCWFQRNEYEVQRLVFKILRTKCGTFLTRHPQIPSALQWIGDGYCGPQCNMLLM